MEQDITKTSDVQLQNDELDNQSQNESISKDEIQDDEISSEEFTEGESSVDAPEEEKKPLSMTDLKKLFRKNERRLKKRNEQLLNENYQLKNLYSSLMNNQSEHVPVAETQNSTPQKMNIDKVIDERVDLRLQRERVQQEQEAEKKRLIDLANQINKGNEKYDDFHEIVMDDENPLTESMVQIIGTLPIEPSDFLYTFSKNRDEVRRIANLSVRDQAKEILKHAFNFKNATHHVSKAPTPSKPLNAMGSAGSKVSQPVTEDTPYEVFRNKYRKGRK